MQNLAKTTSPSLKSGITRQHTKSKSKKIKSHFELIPLHQFTAYSRFCNHPHPSDSNVSEQYTSPNEEYLIKCKDYKIRLVNSYEQRIKANKLIRDRYASKGYITNNSIIPHQNLHQISFEASNDHQVFGTITLTIDSSKGLLADNLYADEINNFRNKNKTVCELSKFASYTKHGSKEIFATLFHLAYIYAYILHNVSDAVIEINPRHVFFYKRMLGFRQIGIERICERVNAPAVLLHLDLDYMSEQISSLSQQDPANSRTIYPYFLSQHEEKRLTKKLRFILSELITQNSKYTQSNTTSLHNHNYGAMLNVVS